MSKIDQISALSAAVGKWKAISIFARRAAKMGAPVKVAVPGSGRVLSVRPCESDLFVLGQIFGREEYAFPAAVLAGLTRLADRWVEEGYTPVVVDGGANVGYSSLYFSRLFPNAVVLAVEPDPVTLQCLRENCQGEPNIRPVHAALWSHDRGVDLSGSEQGSWAHRITGDMGLTPSMRLETLLGETPNAKVLLLKLDIEGGEKEVCRASGDIVREAACIAIEPHDFMLPGHGSLTPLYKALAGKDVDTLLSGENLLIYDVELLEDTKRDAMKSMSAAYKAEVQPIRPIRPIGAVIAGTEYKP